MSRTRILLLFGGESAEHEVSISSARNVYAALDDTKFDVSLVFISKDGHWWLVDAIEEYQSTSGMTQIVPVMGSKTFITVPESQALQPDVIFPVLHGPNGEDGSVQGVAQMMHLPIVGCKVLGSAVCMDKDVAKRLLKHAGLPVVDSVVHRAGEPQPDFAHITLQLGNPLFIKPANLGSSVGVSKATTKEEFEEALAKAHTFDGKVLIEQAVTAREIECAVLGNEKPEASVLGEVKADRDFYSYESKYDPESQSQIIIPAEIDEGVADNLRAMAVKAFTILECQGLARVDFFVTEKNEVFINEINTLPGFTNISMYTKLWRQTGLGYPQLVEKLINLALQGSTHTS